MPLRKSHENPQIREVYEAFYGRPLSEMAEKCCTPNTQTEADILNKKGKRL